MNLSSLAVNTNPSGELVAASPTKHGLLGLAGFLSLPCTGAHPQLIPSGVQVISANKPVKNDPRTSFATIVSGIGMSRCSIPPPLLTVQVTDQSLNASSVSPQLQGSASKVYLNPWDHQPSIPTARPPCIQQMTGKLPFGLAHYLRSSTQSAPTYEKNYVKPLGQEEIVNLRRQSAPAAHISPLVSGGHLLSVQSDVVSSPTLSLQRHNSHIELSSLSGGTSSAQPFQVAGVIQLRFSA